MMSETKQISLRQRFLLTEIKLTKITSTTKCYYNADTNDHEVHGLRMQSLGCSSQTKAITCSSENILAQIMKHCITLIIGDKSQAISVV